jgi:hypothetical protein
MPLKDSEVARKAAEYLANKDDKDDFACCAIRHVIAVDMAGGDERNPETAMEYRDARKHLAFGNHEQCNDILAAFDKLFRPQPRNKEGAWWPMDHPSSKAIRIAALNLFADVLKEDEDFQDFLK